MENYDVVEISTYHLLDNRLSLKARGLLSLLLCYPDSWEQSIEGIAKFSATGIDKLKSTINELSKAGYLHRERTRNANGSFGGIIYTIYSYPQEDS